MSMENDNNVRQDSTTSLGFVDQIQKSASLLNSKEEMLGKGLNVPYVATSSGARLLMASVHQSHALVLSSPEPPYVATGYENRFGDKSSTIIESDSNYEVLAKVSKFSYAPNHHYYLILKDLNNKKITVIERVSHVFKTEEYGHLYNNIVMDSYSVPGSFIPKGTILRRSTGFDQYGNKANGKNLNIAYLASDHNMEDSVIISKACSEKMSAPLIRKVKVLLNENDIPLNIYGDNKIYKVFPDIGEDIKDGILLSYRREKREEAIYTQSVQRLQEILMSDEKITVKGRVIDINIYCNNIDHINKSIYNQQFLAYYNDRLRMDTEIINTVGPYISQGYEMSYELQKLYALAKDELNGKKYTDKKLFSNLIVEFTVIENRNLEVGDKVSDRYGGKGVVSTIIPTELMPKLYNGQPIDMIKNSSTMYNRENAGQIFEIEINYVSMCILDYLREKRMFDPESALNEILKFVKLQSPKQYIDMKRYTDTLSHQDLTYFVESILSKNCIPISNNPMSETMDIDKLGKLYQEFPYVIQHPLMVPIKDSRGNYRFIPTRRAIVAAPQYCLRLKQFAEEKFSATSLSSTNIKNENAKSKASKNYREPNSNTPIKFGQMETGDFDHMGAEYVVINLMLHSLSPHGRRLIEQVATGDPYNVDVKLDTKSKNRSAEILNARLKTMGYRIVFKKIKKHKYQAFYKPALIFGAETGPLNMTPAVEFMEDPDYDYEHWYKVRNESAELKKKMAVSFDAVTFTEDPKKIHEK